MALLNITLMSPDGTPSWGFLVFAVFLALFIASFLLALSVLMFRKTRKRRLSADAT